LVIHERFWCTSESFKTTIKALLLVLTPLQSSLGSKKKHVCRQSCNILLSKSAASRIRSPQSNDESISQLILHEISAPRSVSAEGVTLTFKGGCAKTYKMLRNAHSQNVRGRIYSLPISTEGLRFPDLRGTR